MAKNNPTSTTPLPDTAPPETAYAPPTKGGVYERRPGGDLRKIEPAPIAPAESTLEENRA